MPAYQLLTRLAMGGGDWLPGQVITHRDLSPDKLAILAAKGRIIPAPNMPLSVVGPEWAALEVRMEMSLGSGGVATFLEIEPADVVTAWAQGAEGADDVITVEDARDWQRIVAQKLSTAGG